jgi:hypothetical protein
MLVEQLEGDYDREPDEERRLRVAFGSCSSATAEPGGGKSMLTSMRVLSAANTRVRSAVVGCKTARPARKSTRASRLSSDIV